jgi:hypothetical protein
MLDQILSPSFGDCKCSGRFKIVVVAGAGISAKRRYPSRCSRSLVPAQGSLDLGLPLQIRGYTPSLGQIAMPGSFFSPRRVKFYSGRV